MSNISQWASGTAGNAVAAPNGYLNYTSASAGNAPSDMNDCMREIMAANRRQWEDAEWMNFGDTPTFATTASFTLAGDKTTRYHAGRRIRASAGSITYGKIASSSYSTDTRVSVTLDSGELSAGMSAVALGILSAINQSIPEVSASVAYAKQAGYVPKVDSIGFDNFNSGVLGGALGIGADTFTFAVAASTLTGIVAGNRIYCESMLRVGYIRTVGAQLKMSEMGMSVSGITGQFLKNKTTISKKVAYFSASGSEVGSNIIAGIYQATSNGDMILSPWTAAVSGIGSTVDNSDIQTMMFKIGKV